MWGIERATGRTELSFPERKDIVGGVGVKRRSDAPWGNAKCKMPITHPSAQLKEEVAWGENSQDLLVT